MRQKLISTAILIILGATLFGCSAADDSGPSGVSEAGVSQEFTGPWRDLFQTTYEDSESDIEREALADGQISEQAYSYFQGKIVECLAGLGIEGKFAADKSLEYNNTQNVDQDKINDCNRENGIRVIALKDAIDRNPQRFDESQILVDCMKRVRLVDEGYSTDAYMRSEHIGEIIDTPYFKGCTADPLHFGLKSN